MNNMAGGTNLEWISKRLSRVRNERDLTLREVFEETGIPIPTLSRIERGAAKSLDSMTLLALTEWLGVSMEELKGTPQPIKKQGKEIQEIPDIVELHLRADKNLNKDTASALSDLFRTAYEHCRKLQTKKG
jgi:transcriptional regulator with XRE-family HTH domain